MTVGEAMLRVNARILIWFLTLIPVVGHGDEARSLAHPYSAGLRTEAFSYPPSGNQRISRRVFIWYPTTAASSRHDYQSQIGNVAVSAPVATGRFPTLMFSHGLGGAGDQTIFLTEELARAGYIVAAPDHADSARGGGFGRGRPNFANPNSWDDAKYRDRYEDIEAILNALTTSNGNLKWIATHVDADHIGAIGHSLGGYTILSMIGARPSWHDPRIQAAVLLSPYAMPYLNSRPDINVPVMLQGGTLDLGISPFLPTLFSELSPPKYYLSLKGATHFEWTNLISMRTTTEQAIKQGNARWITQYTRAFFDRHLRGEPSLGLEQPNPALANYEFDTWASCAHCLDARP